MAYICVGTGIPHGLKIRHARASALCNRHFLSNNNDSSAFKNWKFNGPCRYVFKCI